MSAELFFVYDSHCPWSYASTPLVNEIANAFPDIIINLFHCARYEADDKISSATISAVTTDSAATFSTAYQKQLKQNVDSVMTANLMAWVDQKSPHASIALLNALQEAHFQQGKPLNTKEEFEDIIAELKLSPPSKVFTNKKLSKDAEIAVHDIFELQEIINTQAIPALLLAVGENLIMLNHNLYLPTPASIVDAVAQELNNE